MWYEVHILDVGDADAIVIKYRATEVSSLVTAVIDAGNVGDGRKVLDCIGKSSDGKYHIDYAFCTHPDKDHKGGFFDILNNSRVSIGAMCVMDPWEYLEKEDFTTIKYTSSAKEKARRPFDSPTNNAENLIEIAEKRNVLRVVHCGDTFNGIPLGVIGPDQTYYKQCVLGMVEQFAELKEESDFERFNDKAFPDDVKAKSVIDEVEDESCTNKSSMVLLFRPTVGVKFLLCGDAASSSLQNIVNKYGDGLKNCKIKVPHHGSKHNLTTAIIDELSPVSAVISAKGSKKHPNSAVVQWLSKYCNVYSTHKSGNLVYQSEPVTSPATPLKTKIDTKGE